MSKRIDLLNGNIFTSLTRLALPIMATSFIQMAYNMTDMIWIGRLGSSPVAAVGAASLYIWLSNAPAILVRMGGQVKAAQSLGAGDTREANRFAQNALQLGFILAVLFALTMVIFTKPLIAFLKLNAASVVLDAEYYLKIVGAGVVFTILTQVLTGLITSSGNSKTPFVATTIGLVVNILLDPVLIFGFGPIPAMGVTGAAIATVVAQIIVFTLLAMYMYQDDQLFAYIDLKSPPSTHHLKQIVKIGFPAALQSAMMTGIAMILSRMVAAWGDTAIAVQKVGGQIESISWMTADGFSVAVNSFVAQNHGAGNEERAQKGFRTACGIMMLWGLFCCAVLYFFAQPIFYIFIPEAAAQPMGIDYLKIISYSQFFMCLEILTGGAFAGYSRSLPPSVVGITFNVARIPMAILFSSTILGLNGVWWSVTISSILKGVIIFIWFLFFLRKRRITMLQSPTL